MENEDVKVVEQPKVEEPKKEEKPAAKTTAKKRIYFTVDGFGNADFSVDL